MTSNAQQVHTKTHLGHLLNIGDTALGFDFANANINDENLDAVKEEKRPDVVESFFHNWLLLLLRIKVMRFCY